MPRFLLILRSNWISWSGAILTTLSFMAFVTTFVYLTLHGESHGPYFGLLAFIGLPMLFAVGILIIPLGLWIHRRQFQQRMDLVRQKPLKLVRLLAVLTLVNFTTLGTGGYEAVQYMDSQQFCGLVCHKVMSPAYTTYVDSAHAKVACVECHIGSGAASFFKAKLSGLRQVAALALNSYRRPIPTPVHNLRSASETCEHCHWAEQFTSDRLFLREHFADDEAVTSATNVLLMKIGGTRPDGTATGIHWHANSAADIEFVSTDGRRQKVEWVRYVDKAGKEHVYTGADRDPAAPPPAGERRTMDCIDCHNQPSHRQQEPGLAIDVAISGGRIPRQLPAIHKVALDLLQQPWKRDTARVAIGRELARVYDGNTSLDPAVKALVGPAAEAIADIWLRNIYPDMAVDWGTYPSFAGHNGCFRCHDGEHMDGDGVAITSDCNGCHAILAKQETAPEILKQLGYAPR